MTRDAGVFLLLLVAGGAVFATHFDNAFQFDDYHSIVDNPSIRSFGAWRSWLSDISAFSILPENLNYRPLLLATYALSYRLSTLSVWGFHVINWLIHIGVSFLVYAVSRRLFARSPAPDDPLGPEPWLLSPSAAGMALVAAVVYLVHPANSEPVNYISSRSESLATFCVLLSFLAALEQAAAGDRGQPLRAVTLAGSCVLAFAGGLLTKEVALTLPALVFLSDLLVPGPRGVRSRIKARLPLYALLLAVAGGYLILRARLIPPAVAAARSGVDRTTYFFTQIRAWVHYAWEFVWPARLNADATDFGWSPGPGDPRVQVALLLIGLLLAAALFSRRRQPLFTFGIAWFFIALMPTSSVFPLAEPVNGHRAYLPAVGLTIAAVAVFFALAGRPGRIAAGPRLALAAGVLGAVLALLVVGTLERNRVWDSPRSLWTDVVMKSPGNGRAHMNLGLALAAEGDHEGAARQFDAAVATAPGYALAYVNRAGLRRARGDTQGAATDIEASLRLAPENVFVLTAAGRNYAAAGECAVAAMHLQRAHELSPRYPEPLLLLMDVEARCGRAERVPELLAELEALGAATARDRAQAVYSLLLAGHPARALPILERMLADDPGDVIARYNLAYAWIGLGRFEDAERELAQVLARDPAHRAAQQNLAWLRRRADEVAGDDRTHGPGPGPAPAPGPLRGDLPRVLLVPGPAPAAAPASPPAVDRGSIPDRK